MAERYLPIDEYETRRARAHEAMGACGLRRIKSPREQDCLREGGTIASRSTVSVALPSSATSS